MDGDGQAPDALQPTTTARAALPADVRDLLNTDLRSIVVTGVSSGIGYATAKELTSYGYQVFGTVRSAQDADRVRAELGYAFRPLLMDVTDAESIRAAQQEVQSQLAGDSLAGLINNAGIAVAGPLIHLDLDELRYQLEVNVVGLVAVTQAFLPLLQAQPDHAHPPGRIINIGSVSGHTTYPFLAPYAASKHAVEALSDGLRRELMIYGIDVIVMVLGAVQTPMWDKPEQQGLVERFAATDYGESAAQMRAIAGQLGREGMPVEKVAQAIRLALESPKPKPRYVLANNWLFGWVLPRQMPARWMDRAIAKQLGLTRKPDRDGVEDSSAEDGGAEDGGAEG